MEKIIKYATEAAKEKYAGKEIKPKIKNYCPECEIKAFRNKIKKETK